MQENERTFSYNKYICIIIILITWNMYLNKVQSKVNCLHLTMGAEHTSFKEYHFQLCSMLCRSDNYSCSSSRCVIGSKMVRFVIEVIPSAAEHLPFGHVNRHYEHLRRSKRGFYGADEMIIGCMRWTYNCHKYYFLAWLWKSERLMDYLSMPHIYFTHSRMHYA